MVDFQLSAEIMEACLNADCLSLAVVDTSGHYLYVSPYWKELTGIKSTRIIYQNLTYNIIPNSHFDEVLREQRPLIAQPLVSPDLNSVVYANYYPLFNKDRKLLGAMVLTFLSEQRIAVEAAQEIDRISKQLKNAEAYIKHLETAKYSIDQIAGSSECLRNLKEEIMLAAKNNSNVLIEGESGTGKELVAHAIHCLSARRDNRFIRVNCSAIPENLMESEFFGYEAGAFTGADRRGKPGKFELANGGSLFLDEINQLPYTMQPKLLRALQEHEITRIGGTREIAIDARIIAATNVPLRRLVPDGSFRMDLFYRLNVFHIHVPPLRERKSDIPELCNVLVARLNRQLGTSVRSIDPDVMEQLMNYDWPGNIRELQNVLEASIDRSDGHRLRLENLAVFQPLERDRPGRPRLSVRLSAQGPAQITREELMDTIGQCGGNKAKAARMLGISRATLYNWLRGLN